jgi:hypothetical protein
MSGEITRDKFIMATGVEPQDDDLDRCNCPHAGALGHLCCGWDDDHDKPQFMVGARAWNGKPMPHASDGDTRA